MRFLLYPAVVLPVVILLAALVLSVPSQQSELDRYIGEVRAGTMKYRVRAVALADGYHSNVLWIPGEGFLFIKP
ncbi:MAG: hypothetical protein V3T23_13210, partial [Nitrososphaerales archaeon]